jgi:hypothetical protein
MRWFWRTHDLRQRMSAPLAPPLPINAIPNAFAPFSSSGVWTRTVIAGSPRRARPPGENRPCFRLTPIRFCAALPLISEGTIKKPHRDIYGAEPALIPVPFSADALEELKADQVLCRPWGRNCPGLYGRERTRGRTVRRPSPTGSSTNIPFIFKETPHVRDCRNHRQNSPPWART